MRQPLKAWIYSLVMLTFYASLASAAGQATLVKRSTAGSSAGSVTCGTSDPTDTSYYYCPLNNYGSVHIRRQLTEFPCTYQQSWGYDKGGVWVQNGCRAEFAVGLGSSSASKSGNIFGLPSSGPVPRDVVGSKDGQQMVTCSSSNYQHTRCAVRVRNGVRLHRQLSSAPCTQGKSWGYNTQGVWVNHGCRAEFAVR